MIELTDVQAQAIEQQNSPLKVLNPRTREVFVVIRQDVYAHTCKITGDGEKDIGNDSSDKAPFRNEGIEPLKTSPSSVMTERSIPEMPEGIRLALAAFRRDLPELMASRKTRGKHVCYRREQRVAVGKDYRSVIAEVVRLNIPEHEFIVEKVRPDAGSIEEEEIDRTFVEFDEELV